MENLADILAKYPPVPRYTSYPTAPHFYALPEGCRAHWLAEVPAQAVISLYLHLPYCAKQCWYCGCHTRISRRYEPVTRYLESVATEIAQVAQQLGRWQRVGHIHFGGGSPSMLHAPDFTRMMQHLRAAFTIEPDAEIAIEIDPRTASEAKIAAYAHAGVNRISIGVQDFDPAVQQAINRVQHFSTVYETVRLAHEYGLHRQSFDLVYGLPCQTFSGFQDTLEQVLYLRPGRVALFGYAHVPWVKKAMRLIDAATLPDTALRCAMATWATDRLRRAGYEAVGLDHFALPDDPLAVAAREQNLKRNFQGYGTDASDILLGLGASAISYLPQGYVQNPPLIETYAGMLKQGMLPQQKGFTLGAQDRLRKQVIDTLMCYGRVALDKICTIHGLPEDSLDSSLIALQSLVADGLVELQGRELSVCAQVPQALRLACAAFDTYYVARPMQHAQVA